MRRVTLLVLLVLTIVGASQLAFLCDDAFITFRYVSNAREGLGLVWNPPPFLPVEGYTGFLWALVLWATWSLCGVEPPDAANVLSITFGAGQFVLVAIAALRLRGKDGNRVGDVVALTTIACIVGNRSFLQWMTSGLETSLFNLAFLAWALLAFRQADRRDARWLMAWSCASAIAGLTRPDGLLLVVATAVAALPSLASAHRRPGVVALGLTPLLSILAHVLWRRSFYGEWLPNTYQAKIVADWPEAGGRYFACFLIEHGLWLWFPVALVWVTALLLQQRGAIVAMLWRQAPALVALGAIGFHMGYYIQKVGGDHFEYRVLSQLVPLAWLSFAAMASQLVGGRAVPLLLGGLWLASSVGWVHLWLTRDMPENGFNPLAHKVPACLQPMARWYDRHQGWLHLHFVCLRCNQHARSLRGFQSWQPLRGRFAASDGDLPVAGSTVVGWAGWVLSDCVIIDKHGLNDWVAARTPVQTTAGAALDATITPLFVAGDKNGDGWLDRDELKLLGGVLKSSVAGPRGDSGGGSGGGNEDAVVDALLGLFAVERPDMLAVAEAKEIARGTFSRGCMAHERFAPPGYVEAFEPNLIIVDRKVTVTPRREPIKPRVPAIEAEWREKVRLGQLPR